MGSELLIASTVAQSLHAADQHDDQRLGELWSSNAQLNQTTGASARKHVDGREAIIAELISGTSTTIRFMAKAHVKIKTATTAEVYYTVFLAQKGSEPREPAMEKYCDQLELIDNRWKITARDIEPLTGNAMNLLEGFLPAL